MTNEQVKDVLKQHVIQDVYLGYNSITLKLSNSKEVEIGASICNCDEPCLDIAIFETQRKHLGGVELN